MNQENCDICYKIICKQCGWEASDAEVSCIQKGTLTACPKCGWKPGDEVSLDEKRTAMAHFLRENKLAVLATNVTSHHSPESAVVAYVEDDDLCLYFQTGKYTRKAQNLGKNQLVSFVVGLDSEKIATMQYEGKAELLKRAYDIDICKEKFLAKKSPTTVEYLERPDAIFYKVIPSWIRLSDYTSGPHATVMELNV